MSSGIGSTVVQQVRAILHRQSVGQHHFGRPFMTAYQIAIEFRMQNPIYQPSLPVGGLGAGPGQSLAQHLALLLSHGISTGQIVDIQGAFLSNAHLTSLQFNGGIVSSLTGTNRGVSMFRLIP
jgi:hypothetical protein